MVKYLVKQGMELQDEFYSNAEYIETVCVVNFMLVTQFELSRLIPEKQPKTDCERQTTSIFSLEEFLLQASGNKVSRQSVLCGSQNIVINGKVRYSCVIDSTSRNTAVHAESQRLLIPHNYISNNI